MMDTLQQLLCNFMKQPQQNDNTFFDQFVALGNDAKCEMAKEGGGT